ncbi:MAG: rhomboid family intramembrane serine protease [Bacteroidota bacterium]
MQRFTGVVKHLVIINVLFFLASQAIPLDILALRFPEVPSFQPFQIITHMFMHGGLMHILFNMFALWMFGSAVESVWGPKRFLFFYLAAGLGAALFTIGVDYYQYFSDPQTFRYSLMVGASGAIMGVLVAFGMLFPNAELMLLFFPVPVKAKYFIPVIVVMDIFSGITGVSIFSPSNTAYWAHVGGALAGLIMVLFWRGTQFDNNRWN